MIFIVVASVIIVTIIISIMSQAISIKFWNLVGFDIYLAIQDMIWMITNMKYAFGTGQIE